jgi:farnesyl-diphosphate farnesyltransferase
MPLGVTYLVARAADTIADTPAVPAADRQRGLLALRTVIGGDEADGLASLAARVGPDHPAAERALLARLPEVFAAYRALAPPDRGRAQAVLLTLTQAMLDTLARFPPETTGSPRALETRGDLDRYTYMNAGCVGEFWTETVIAHHPACAGGDRAAMRARGKHFGQGLQLVNVLRDLARDLRIGRCYLPRADLAALGLAPEDLLDPAVMPRVRPLLEALVHQALVWLDEARAYTLALPRREVRLRLACAWPLLLGLATLARLRRADGLLDPAVVVKVPRPEVRRLLVRSAVRVASNRSLDHYIHRLAAAASGPWVGDGGGREAQ